MRKLFKISTQLLSTIIIIVVVVPMILSLVIRSSSVQTWVIRHAAEFISKKIDSEISIGRIDIGHNYRVIIDDFFVQSKLGRDTLLYAKRLTTQLSGFVTLQYDLELSSVKIDGGELNLYAQDSTTNIKDVIEKIRGGAPKNPNAKPFNMFISDVEIDNFIFRYQKAENEEVAYGINYQDLEMNDMNLRINDLNILNDSIIMQIDNISFKEKSGIEMNKLTSQQLIVSSSEISLKRAELRVDSTTFIKAPEIKIAYSEWNMQDYINRVQMKANISDSKIDFTTIEKFTKERRSWNSIITFNGTFEGTVARMSGVIKRATTGSTIIQDTKYSINGIPDIENTLFSINVEDMTTRLYDVESIISNFSKSGGLNLSDNMVKDSDIHIKGDFRGKLSRFNAKCDIVVPDYKSNGKTKVDLNMERGNGLTIDGSVSMKDLNIRRFVKSNDVGRVTANLNLNGVMKKNGSLIDLKGEIELLQYKGYDYNSIKLNGNLNDQAFTGSVSSTDNNLNFEFNGLLDFTNQLPTYNFNLDLKRANLHAIGINKRDSISIFSGRVLAEGQGDNIDNLNSTIIIDKLQYINHSDTTIADNTIKIEAANNETSKSLTINSEYFDIDFKGVHSYNLLLDYIKSSAARYLPALTDEEGKTSLMRSISPIVSQNRGEADDYYAISAIFKKPNNIANIFLPSLKLSDDTKLIFLFNPSADSFSLNFSSSFIQYEGYLISGISIDTKNNSSTIDLFARTEEMYANNLYLPNFSIIGKINNNNITADLGFSNSVDNSYAMIKTQSTIYRNGEKELEYKVTMLPSTINLYKETWKTTDGNIYINKESIKVDNFNLNSTGQSLNLEGVISANQSDTIRLKLNKFSLSPISIFTSSMGFDIKGDVTGDVIASALKSKQLRKVTTELSFNNNIINGIALPEAHFSTKWRENEKVMLFDFVSGDTKFIWGNLNIDNKQYLANVKIDSFNVALIAPFLYGIADDVSGSANVDVTLSNPKDYFEINGNVDIPNVSCVITPTNSQYNISGRAEIVNNQYELKDGKIEDGVGGVGTLTAYMTNEKYKKVNYKLTIKADKLLCLNTTERDNALFYGKVFASGDVQITGDRNKITLGVDATSTKRSTFFLPLGGKNLSEVSFIKFKNQNLGSTKKGLILQKEANKNSTSFEMKMRVTATPLLETEIVMDQTTGSSIKATGNGTLDINIQPSNEIFDINGEYTIDKGTYRFILPNFKVFDKFFTIKNGSWIRWAGDPLNATLNVDAIYKLKASLAPLLGNNDSYRNRVNVDCILNIRDKLTHPTITLGVDVPDAGPEEQSILKSALNTQEAISTQIFFLLVSNSFYSTGGTVNNNATVGISSTMTTGIEFLSNQINNILSSEKFDFGINYRPSSDMTSDEFEIDFSAPILNNKLYLDVSGNYNFMNNASASINGRQSNWSGDVYLTWLLNNSGNLSLKGFTKTIDTFDENQGLQESGVGIYFKSDFDNIKDLRARYREYIKKRREAAIERKKKRIEKRKHSININ